MAQCNNVVNNVVSFDCANQIVRCVCARCKSKGVQQVKG